MQPQETKAKTKYPKSVFFIIGNEFCERFSYYGMKTVLTLFLKYVLLYSEDTATVIFHAFAMACYFTPLFGAMLADSFLGKFRTIFYISILYCMGNVIISLASVPNFLPMRPVTIIGLILIAIGTGGIKPCVSAFGGDQFSPDQEKQLKRFFSLFYLSINAGSLLSTFLTPVLRADVKCFGEDTCFPLAFGVPAGLMIVALILFLAGRPMYRIVPSTSNVIADVTRCTSHALVRKGMAKKEEIVKEHWLDYADDKYSKSLISDIKVLLRVLVLYLPLPVFWALFDQQGSRWTFQATRLDGSFLGYTIKPDQIQVINPVLIVALIPCFEYIIYPLLRKCRILVKPLQRITAGGLLAASSFVIAAFLQISLENSLQAPPPVGFSSITIVNRAPCAVNIDALQKQIQPKEKLFLPEIKSNVQHKWKINPEGCNPSVQPLHYILLSNGSSAETIVIMERDAELNVFKFEDSLKKSDRGEANLRVLYQLYGNATQNTTVHIRGKDDYHLGPSDQETVSDNVMLTTSYSSVSPGKYDIEVTGQQVPQEGNEGVEFKSGGNYLFIGAFDDREKKLVWSSHAIVEPNVIPMLWQVPQYVIMTAGEIMFSITGLEFSYSQAPQSMKSVLQAAWLLTVAFGNLIVLIIAEAKLFEKQSQEFFMFAGLMVLDMILFAVMAYFYKPVDSSSDKDQAKEKLPSNDKLEEYNTAKSETLHTKGVTNEAYQEDTKM